jgi:hypothetical protein
MNGIIWMRETLKAFDEKTGRNERSPQCGDAKNEIAEDTGQ